MQISEEYRGLSLAFVRLRQTKGYTQDDKLLKVFNGITERFEDASTAITRIEKC